MTRDVISLGPGHSIRHAAELMVKKGVSGLPVLNDDGDLVGILTEGDLMRRMEIGYAPVRAAERKLDKPDDDIRAYVRSQSWSVNDVMSRNVKTAHEDTLLDELAEDMNRNNIKRVPIIRDNQLIGIVSRADLLRAIVAAPGDRTAIGDEPLLRSIQSRLQTDLDLSSQSVTVNVNKGVVTLSGTVGSESMREAARVASEGVRGCQAVINNIAVAGADPSETSHRAR